jgi:hypothetical protein
MYHALSIAWTICLPVELFYHHQHASIGKRERRGDENVPIERGP